MLNNLFAGRELRILLAEDNITNQQVALGILKKLGLKADAVANGAEALKALETLPYDLVLMDVQMPEMDGFEATREIRNWKPETGEDGVHRGSGVKCRDSGIPIIAMTAHAMQGDRERCLEAGMNDYIEKPVSPQALAETLDKWLPKETDEYRKKKKEIDEYRKKKKEIDEYRKKKKEIDEDGKPSSIINTSLIFDRADMMSRLMDDEDLARTVVAAFLADIPQQIAALRDYLEVGDAPGAERQAHTIKGASANVSGEALRAVAFEMEKAARAGDLSAARGYMPELEAQFDRLNQAMTKEL